MLSLSTHRRYYFYNLPCNVSGSFDFLSGLVNTHMEGDLLSGDLFVFINKRRNQLKLLQWSQMVSPSTIKDPRRVSKEM